MTAAIERRHRKSSARVAEPEDNRLPDILFGIIEASYSCKLP